MPSLRTGCPEGELFPGQGRAMQFLLVQTPEALDSSLTLVAESLHHLLWTVVSQHWMAPAAGMCRAHP